MLSYVSILCQESGTEKAEIKKKSNMGNEVFSLLLVSWEKVIEYAVEQVLNVVTQVIFHSVSVPFLRRAALFPLCIFLNSSLPQPPGLLLSAFKDPQVKLSTEVALWVGVNAGPAGAERTSCVCVHAISQAFLSPLASASAPRLLWMSRMVFGWVMGIVCSQESIITLSGKKKKKKTGSVSLFLCRGWGVKSLVATPLSGRRLVGDWGKGGDGEERGTFGQFWSF